MQQIPLDAVSSQKVIVYLEGDRYSITLKESNSGSVLASIQRNDTELVSNIVCVFGTPLLPYPFIEKGNFAFLTTNDDMPDWKLFGIDHFLFYFTIDEVLELRRD